MTTDETRLSIEGLGAAKEARGSALLQEKQVHKKTNFEPTTTATLAVGSQANGYSNESTATSINESRLSIEGVGVEKEARGSALMQQKQVHLKSNFERTTTTTTFAVGS